MPSASALKAGKAVIELGLESEGVRAGLDKVEDRLRKFGKQLQTFGKQMILFGGTITAAFVPAIKAASDFEETLSKFNVVFGDRSKEVREWGQLFGKTIGRSETQVLGFLASFQDLFVPIGFEPGAAEEMSKQVTQLAFDLASFNNMADADVVRDLQAAITGSGETMKKYGTIVNEAAVKQELLNMGLDPSTATNSEKAMARLNIVFQQTTAAQGDAIRTADGFANRLKAARAELENTAVVIGQALLPLLAQVLSIITPLIQRFGEWAQQNQKLFQTILVTSAALTAFGVVSLVLGKALIGLQVALKAVKLAMTALAKHPLLAVLTIATIVVLELAGAFDLLQKKIDELTGVEDVTKGLEGQLASVRKEMDALTGGKIQPAQLAVAGGGRINTASLFDTRLAFQIFGQKGSRVEDEQLRVLRNIEKNTEQPPGIDVI